MLHHPSSFPVTGNQKSKRLLREFRGLAAGNDLSLEKNIQSVTYTQNLRQVCAYQEDCCSSIAPFDKKLVDIMDCSYIQASGRIGSQYEMRIRAQFPGDDGLLLVSTGKMADLYIDAAGPDIILGSDPLGQAGEPPLVFHTCPVLEFGAVVIAQIIVVAKRFIWNHCISMSV